MKPDEFKDACAQLSRLELALLAGLIANRLTVLGREAYEASGPEIAGARLRAINERVHRITGGLVEVLYETDISNAVDYLASQCASAATSEGNVVRQVFEASLAVVRAHRQPGGEHPR